MIVRLLEMLRQRRNRKKIYSTESYWDSKALTYSDTAVSMWPNQTLNHHYEVEQKKMISRHVGKISGKSLLDLGCGTGRFSRWFAEQGALVTGHDFSSGALSIAKKQSKGISPDYQHASVFELVDEAAYDVVFTWGVLTIACQDEAQLLDALKRMRRSLRPGGILLLTEPIHRGLLHRVLDMDLSCFLNVMRNAGFEILATDPLHFWPARIVLAYFNWPAWTTTPVYYCGQLAMKLPGLSQLGDYWAVLAHPSKTSS